MMSEFMLFFRWAKRAQPSPDQFQATMKLWQDWLGGISAQNKLVSNGNRLSPDGKVVRSSGVVTDGPYAEVKESLGGYMVVRAKDYDEAVGMSKGCPVLKDGGSVEVREVIAA
jgi:hypothetical protein